MSLGARSERARSMRRKRVESGCSITARILMSVTLSFAITAPAAAQDTFVAGIVVNSGTLQPIPGAQITVVGTQLGMVSDARGRFRIQGLSGTEVTLRVEMLGYRTITQVVRVGDPAIRLALSECVEKPFILGSAA